MKLTNNFRTLACALAVSLTLTATASAMGKNRPTNPTAAIPTGSYQGLSDQGAKTHLLVKPLVGRVGSYFGLLIWSNGAGRAYVIDPITVGSSYAMTPLQITADGETGIVDENPSLVLNLDGSRINGWPGFTISDAKSGNQVGFQGSSVFKAGDLSSYIWTEITRGSYQGIKRNSNENITLSSMDANHQATAFFTGDRRELNGNFFVREKAPGVFTLHENTVTSTGPEMKEMPSKIMVFVNGQIVLVSVQDGTIIGRFKR